MNPKSGKKVTPVKPSTPEDPFEADEADPGVVEKIKADQAQKQAGKYGTQPAKPFKHGQDGAPQDAPKKSWIEIELIDEEDNPVPGERYEIKLPDGSTTTGTLDGNGFARIDGIDPGSCEITFPKLDKDAWDKA